MKMTDQTFEQKWMHEFVVRLKHRMEYLDISQKELVKRTGLSQGAVNRWFHYKNGPTAMHLVKIAKALAVKPDYLIDFPDSTYDDQPEEE